MNTASRLTLVYLFMAVLGLSLIAPTMPPFRNADEMNHLFRADQISHLGLLPRRIPDGEQGGWVDAGLVRAAIPFQALPPGAKMARPMYAPQAWDVPVPAGFPNTAIYPPFFYLPQAAAIFAARHWTLTVLQGATLARLAAGLAAIVAGAAAIKLAAQGGIWLYALLLLPMSVSLTAAASQDGLILACTALAASLTQRARRQGGRVMFVAATLLFAVLGCARPPYAAFAAALLLTRRPVREQLFGIGLVFAATLSWAAIAAPHVVLPVFPQGAVDPAAQAIGLLRAPFRLPELLLGTWRVHGAELVSGFVGTLGWLDTALPQYFHLLAWMMLGCAAVAAAGWERPCVVWWIASGGILGAVLGVVLVQYLAWTVPGAAVVEGLQGRYFLPPALMLIVLLPGMSAPKPWTAPLRALVMVFPAFSIAVTVHALLLRFYV